MAENSKIEWTDHTFNPWLGCTRVSPGCEHCYAEATAKTYKMVGWGVKANRRRTGADNWRAPARWNAKAERLGRRYSVFCASMADVFDDHASILPEWRGDLWKLIADTPNLDWLLLTKRPENWAKFLPARSPGNKWRHVRIGCTIEDQRRMDERRAHLEREHAHGWPTFVSYEPALGPVEWRPAMRGIDWLICGGESGHGARPMHPAWARSAMRACAETYTPFFFKQWGEWTRWEPRFPADVIHLATDGTQHREPINAGAGGEPMVKVGKKVAGRTLDGRLHDGVPA